MSCDGLIYHKGLLRCSLSKKTLEVVELPHPDDLVLHSLAGIDPPLIHQTIKMFSAQFWQQGDLICITEGELFNMSATILSVDFQNKSATVVIDSNGTLPVQHSCPISSLQCTYRRGDSVKVFAGSDRGTEGCVVDHSGENIILTVHRTGEIIEVCTLYALDCAQLISKRFKLIPSSYIHLLLPTGLQRSHDNQTHFHIILSHTRMPFKLVTMLPSFMVHSAASEGLSYGLHSQCCGFSR